MVPLGDDLRADDDVVFMFADVIQQRTEVFLRGTNLTDAEARPHASFLKDYAPLPARSLTAGVRLEF